MLIKKMMSAYARFIVRHSYMILFTISVISTILTVIPLVCHNLPNFSDPVVGFETRGTTLAHRFIAWENLIDETRPSRKLAVNPKDIEDQIRINRTYHNRTKQDKTRSGLPRAKNKGKGRKKYLNNSSIYQKAWYDKSDNFNELKGHIHWGYGKNVSFEDENSIFIKDHTRKQWVSLKEMERKPDKPLHKNFATGNCGPPMADYSHLIVTTEDGSSLLDYKNIASMCQMQSVLIDIAVTEYHDLCQRTSQSQELCCPLWSVPNYIALISGKHSCENITEVDVNKTVAILQQCAGYFHNFTLMASCDLDRCKVPKFCSQYDAVYNILFYLIDSEAFSPPNFDTTFVKHAMIFLPLSRSSTVLPYYMKLQSTNMSYDSLSIPAVDFGLKNALFDLWIIQDTWLVGMGGLFVFLSVWIYTRSLILTILLFTAIAFSLGISYFLYIYIFHLEFFPFMNLLVIVVVIGIGSDDAFLFVKVWKTISKQLVGDNIGHENDLTDIKNIYSAGETILIQILEQTLNHTVVTILVTTLTTAAAFLASYLSFIPAINCFSVFAGTTVLVNFLLMITWLPASVFVVTVKLHSNRKGLLDFVYKPILDVWEDVRVILNRYIITCVTRLHIIFVIVFGAIGIYSIIVVFYSPGLRLPDSKEFQLFQTSHPFEKYEINYRDKFLFERFGKDLGTGSKMPLRWIWGIKAVDNGNHMDPSSTGHLVFDNDFTISDPKAQLWLLGFCARLKSQPFYQQTLGPLLPNCFIESFKMFMSRKCVDKIDKIDRTPCCEVSRFPYKKEVFNLCIIKAIESLYQTPRELFIRGVAGPKFLRSAKPPRVVAIVIEFESVVPYSMSYNTMNNFFLHVENWTENEIKSAPKGMKCGWFLSDFEFYDLQGTLAAGTVTALIVSAVLGFFVLLPATLNLIVCICAISSMIFSCTVTIAVLVLNGWKLNVLESVAISTSAGLAVDFSLHYALSYTNACGTNSARVKSCLSSSAGPTAAAALTTGFSGIFLLRSNLLPYSQIGTFLALIMSFSWLYATFFLCSVLHIFGKNSTKAAAPDERKSVSRVSSICSGIPNLESHELEHLADSNRTNVTHSHSPSSVSATTVVLHDEFDNSISKVDKKKASVDNRAKSKADSTFQVDDN